MNVKGRERKGSKCCAIVKNNLQTVLLVLGVVVGISFGFIIRSATNEREWTAREISYISFPGDLVLSMLKGLTVPLITSSIITAVGSLDLKLMGKIGGRAILYYLTTTIIAVTIAILLSISIQPGKRMETSHFKQSAQQFEPTLTQDAVMDIFRQLFPPNIVQAAVQTYRTKLMLPPGTNKNSTLPLEEYEMNGEFLSGVNVMGLMIFSIAIGVALTFLGKRGEPVFRFAQSFSEAMMLVTSWIIWITPLGILFLLCAEVLKIKDFTGVLLPLGLYLITTLIGYAIHALIILPAIYVIFIRKLPFKFIANMGPALTMSIGTSSTLATLPVTLKCLEGANGIDTRITRFLMPVAATINMDAMALYEAAAVLYIAQLAGVDLNIGKMIAVSFTATVASVGASSIPQSGLVMMVMVLTTVGLPVEYISFILPVDWILDRLMTAVNLLSDSVGAAIISHVSQNDLNESGIGVEHKKNPIDETELSSARLTLNSTGSHAGHHEEV